MQRTRFGARYVAGVFAAAFGVLVSACDGEEAVSPGGAKVSEFGRYEGYSQARYTQYVRSSEYVEMRDGVRLAVDVYRPAVNGVAVDVPMPVLLMYSRYRRANELPDGTIKTPLGPLPKGETTGDLDVSAHQGRESIPVLLAHGYIFAIADSRGTGASFGVFKGEYSGQEGRDGHDIVEWLAAQPYTTDKVGMIGGSYRGGAQLVTAAANPPHLGAIFPAVAPFDIYRTYWSDTGVFRKAAGRWVLRTMASDGVLSAGDGSKRPTPARVDADTDGALLAAALEERKQGGRGADPFGVIIGSSPKLAEGLGAFAQAAQLADQSKIVAAMFSPTDQLADLLSGNPDVAAMLAGIPFPREVVSPTDFDPEGANTTVSQLAALNAAGVPTYSWGGWLDQDTFGAFALHANLAGPRKLTMGPWSHGPNETNEPREEEALRIYVAEQLRWFDYWLKGVDNGVLDEPSINYAVVHDRTGWQWRQADEWPIAEATSTAFYFAPGPSESVQSVNDGLLSETVPDKAAREAFTVDYAATTGRSNRFYDSVGAKGLEYPDLIAHAATALTYTTAPLMDDLTVAGHPVVTLSASSTAPDGEFNVYLQEVNADGSAVYLTDGVVRASHSALGEAPYDKFGLPFLTSSAADVEAAAALNEGVMTLTFDLQPIANRFEKGHRIRIVVTGADADNNMTFPFVPAPTQSLHLGGAEPSRIELPVLPQKDEKRHD